MKLKEFVEKIARKLAGKAAEEDLGGIILLWEGNGEELASADILIQGNTNTIPKELRSGDDVKDSNVVTAYSLYRAIKSSEEVHAIISSALEIFEDEQKKKDQATYASAKLFVSMIKGQKKS